MKKFIKRSKTGAAMIETIFDFVIIMTLLCMFMALWQPIMIYLNVNHYAKTITSAIECSGEATEAVVEDGVLEDLDDSMSIGKRFEVVPAKAKPKSIPSTYVKYLSDDTMTGIGTVGVAVYVYPTDSWFNKSKRRLQLGDGFNVVVTCERDINIRLFGVDVNIPMTYTRQLYGVSQVYWKP